jgi:hypothetical protein
LGKKRDLLGGGRANLFDKVVGVFCRAIRGESGFHLKFVIPVHTEHAFRAAEDDQDHRVFLAWLPTKWLDEEAFDGLAGAALVGETLGRTD